jgi:phosphoribosylamine---glycine ligase
MNFFMYSKCGEGAGLLKRIQDEGNSCALYIEEKDYSNVYDGILVKSDTPSNSDIIIFDSSGMGNSAEYYRKRNFKVFGASQFHDKLENDREFGLDFMWNHGISIPETASFSNFKEGISFVKRNKNKRYVFKPSGKNIPTKLTYSCSDSEDLINYMNYIEENFGKEIDDFVLQEFVDGALLSSEYWVGTKGFLTPINHTIEVKKFMNDDIGPSTGCSGNIVWQGDDNSDVAILLKGIEEDLISEGFIGPIDLNAIINEEGIFGLEWTPRFGLDALPTLLPLINGDIGKIIYDCVNGTANKMDLYPSFSGGARLTIPPYPIEPESLKEIEKNSPNLGIPIRGLDNYSDYCYFYEVMKKDNELVHSSGTGVIACISDLGEDIEDCFEIVNEALDECKVPDKQYRTDLDKILPKMYKKAQEVLKVYA